MSKGVLWKLSRRLWGYRLAGRLFFQQAVDGRGNALPLHPVWGRLNQWMTERGWCPPWIMTREEIEAYWRTRDNSADGNRPRVFAGKSVEIVEFMHRFWSPEVSSRDDILELGANCGANLNGLWQLGYRRLGGVEINPHALDEMKHTFPYIAEQCAITMMPIDAYLAAAPARSVDVIYTMAVAHHLHPALNRVFRDMTRVARRHICVIETEAANCTYQFARNFKRVFERLGCREVRSADPAATVHSIDYGGYTARLFAVPR
jgi:hypothetical protein